MRARRACAAARAEGPAKPHQRCSQQPTKVPWGRYRTRNKAICLPGATRRARETATAHSVQDTSLNRLRAHEAMRVHILWALAATAAAFTPPQPPAHNTTVCHGGRPKNKAAKAAQKRLQEAAKEEAKAARTYEALQKKRRESKARRTERLRGRDTRGGTPDVVEVVTEKKARRPPPTTPRAEPTKGQAKRPIQSNRQLEARFLGLVYYPGRDAARPVPGNRVCRKK